MPFLSTRLGQIPHPHIKPTTCPSFHEWFWFEASPKDQRLGTILWYIWKRQGMNNYSPPQPLDPWIIIRKIIFFSSTVEHHQPLTPFLKMKWIANLPSEKWIPSPPDKVRLNFDGSLNVQTAGIGGIIRTLVKPRRARNTSSGVIEP